MVKEDAHGEVQDDPEQEAQGIEDRESEKSDARDSRQGGGDRVEAGNELCDQERPEAVAGEEILGAPNAGIGLERDPAEEGQDVVAAPAATNPFLMKERRFARRFRLFRKCLIDSLL